VLMFVKGMGGGEQYKLLVNWPVFFCKDHGILALIRGRKNGMAITEETLLRSGFTKEELQKLKRYVDTQSTTLDILLPVLSNRFKGTFILSIVLTVLFILAVCFASRENIISSGVAVLFIFGIFCWMTPLKLTYKAWRFTRDYYQ